MTISGSGARANSLVTVGTTLGTITSADQEGNYAGTQVLANASGSFTFTMQTAVGGQATLSAREVTGLSSGQVSVNVNPSPPSSALSLKFAFDASFNANGGAGPSPTQAGYTSVVSTPYSPSLGYGWLNTPPGNYDRGAATLQAPISGAPNVQPLLESFNDGADNTFRVDLQAGTTYTVTVTMGDTRAATVPWISSRSSMASPRA